MSAPTQFYNGPFSGAQLDSAIAGYQKSSLESYRRSVNVADYFAPGESADGIADNTATVAAAYAVLSATNGGELFFPAGIWKFNLVITKPNVTIAGASSTRSGYQGTVGFSSLFKPADITLPVIQIGNDTGYVRGIKIRDVTIEGQSTGALGLYFAGGAFECTVENAAISYFTTCIKIQGGTTYPASLIYFYRVDGQPANVTNARGFLFLNTANYPTSYTTEIVLTNCHWDGPSSATGSYVMEVDSCEIKMVNTYFDVYGGHGVKISHTFSPSPWINGTNSNIDAGLFTNVAVEGYDNGRKFSGLASVNLQINGKYKELDGTLMQAPKCHLRQDTFLIYPSIYGAISFTDVTDSAWLGGTYNKYQIYAGTAALYFDTTSGLGQEKHYLGSGVCLFQNTNPTPDGNTYLQFFDSVNSKSSSIHQLNGFIDIRPAAGSGTRLQTSDGSATGLQVNGTGAGVFLLGSNIVANQGIYVDSNKQIQSGVLVDFVQTTAATIANTVTETTLIGSVSGPGKTLIANRFTAGKNFKGRFRGRYSTTGTPTLQLKVKLGSTVILDTGAITLGSGVTNKYFEIEFDITCRTTGSSGTVFAEGKAIFDTVIIPIVNTAATTINTTVTQTVDVTATWGTASASNTVTGATGLFAEGF